jgi:predicted DNA-binding transcriptional regulator AlpA
MSDKLQQIIREKDLFKYTGLKRSQLHELIRNGEFPQPFKLSSTGRTIAWAESQILAWQQEQLAKLDGDTAPPAAKAGNGKVQRLSR